MTVFISPEEIKTIASLSPGLLKAINAFEIFGSAVDVEVSENPYWHDVRVEILVRMSATSLLVVWFCDDIKKEWSGNWIDGYKKSICENFFNVVKCWCNQLKYDAGMNFFNDQAHEKMYLDALAGVE